MLVLLAALLSLLFFSAVLAAESRGGDRRRIREVGLVVLILALVATYASAAMVNEHWPESASLSSL
ncbi:MAG TPA: hypothetical protein VLX85_09825, partial [Stellaceae bacterium]|nr:hypothetical protein [Stellaceae bacterium]